ncbi:uncharacterized protein LOC108672967 isoform X2 [Hyalella azteca]|uniref:Uncharacterized protein LOC108672967 isoform X2 n=1 Tax=Hyalella azteca TaxID=294128 RepID=A0A8B7NR59_HYAAZ|nr:uncharacterized protein LOC108672967 isoform X2 [Hyalella azteca]
MFPRKWILLQLFFLAAVASVSTDNSTQSSETEQDSSQLEAPRQSTAREKRSELQIKVDKKLQTSIEEDLPRMFHPPTELQIAQARKLFLKEGDKGDSSPEFLQQMDLDGDSVKSASSPFSYRLTNTSFLQSLNDKELLNRFSNLRKAIDHEGSQEKDTKDDESTSYSPKNQASNDAKKSIDDRIHKDKLLLAEMISKKSGFAYRPPDVRDDPLEEELQTNEETQLRDTRVAAPPPLCPPGSGLCRTLRERLQEDLVSSFSDPFTNRIRYRLKKRPSVYTTKTPRIRNDIGIPDIYETEVTVMPHFGQNSSTPHGPLSRLHRHDHSVAAADNDQRLVLPPRRSPLPLGALRLRNQEENEVKMTQETGAIRGSKRSKSKNHRRESQSGIRDYLTERGYGRPSRVRTRTHLDYRRPLSFKFKRTNDARNKEIPTEYKNLNVHKITDASLIHLHPLLKPNSPHENIPLSSSIHSHELPTKPRRENRKEQPTRPQIILDHRSEELKHKNDKTIVGNNEKHSGYDEHRFYEPPAVTTTASVFYEQQQEYHPPESSKNENKYNVPIPPHRYEIPSAIRHSVPKSPAVPGWLMDLKSDSRHPTPQPNHEYSKHTENPISYSSPMPSDYALKASQPSALSVTYTTPRNYESSRHLPSSPDHFRIINPNENLRTYNSPPPPHIHVPLESQLLPKLDSGKKIIKSPVLPHYPVIPSPDQSSGSKYSVQVTTPSGIYVTPVRISSTPKHVTRELPIYAPPTSPNPTYGPPRHDPAISSHSPHPEVSPHPHKAHINAGEVMSYHSKNLPSYPKVTQLSPIKHEVSVYEHEVNTHSVASHHVLVTPKSHHVSITPKNIPATISYRGTTPTPLKINTPSQVIPTTFKPLVAKDDLAKLKGSSQASTVQVTQKPVKSPHSTSIHSPVAHRETTYMKTQPNQDLPEISLVPYILQDYQLGTSSPGDYFDFDDDDYYYDDLYDYDYLLDVLGVTESRSQLPLHVLPSSYPDGHIQSFGYIAGVPGRAGKDYPILGYIPNTSFGCGLVAEYPGYYADMDAGCQVFHVCHHDGTQDSYLCPNGTVFNQKYFVCDWWYNFNCEDAPFFYPVNAALSFAALSLHQPSAHYETPTSLLRSTRGSKRPTGHGSRQQPKRRMPSRRPIPHGGRRSHSDLVSQRGVGHHAVASPRGVFHHAVESPRGVVHNDVASSSVHQVILSPDGPGADHVGLHLAQQLPRTPSEVWLSSRTNETQSVTDDVP